MTGRKRKRGKIGIEGAFIAHSLTLRESVAWQCLPDNARRVLDRLEVEHARHGGSENGRLRCPYGDFVKAGIRRNSIAPAIRACQALGFLQVTAQGGRSISMERWPSTYRLTYLVGRGDSPDPTHEWRKIEDAGVADELVAAAKTDRNHATQGASKRKKPAAKTTPEPAAKTLPDLGVPGGENDTPEPAAKTIPLYISRGQRAFG